MNAVGQSWIQMSAVGHWCVRCDLLKAVTVRKLPSGVAENSRDLGVALAELRWDHSP